MNARGWIIVPTSMLLWFASTSHGELLFNDALASEQWYLQRMNFGQAWSQIAEQPRRGKVTVAVIDSGFDFTHPDLRIVSTHAINIVDGSKQIDPVHPHGTATAGLIGARSGNEIGILQPALTADLLPIRVSNRPDGATYSSHIANAVRYAADHGARVINVSYKGVDSREIARAAWYAFRKGAITVMAAGNDGRE